MGKIFTLSFCVLISLRLYAQTSETHNFITYDTTYNGPVGTWQIRITRPVNMFTPGSADTASRPAIITMPGIGETGNANPANLTAYGPHYWLLNGWDGSVVLGNGVHYPILITVAFVSNTWPAGEQTSDVLSFLLSHYHIKKSSVHLGGLSLGSFMWTSLIAFEATPGAETGMSMVTSITALEGFSLYEDAPYSTWSRGDVAYQVWAQKYHGKYFGLEGTDDYRNVAEGEKDMNSVVPGSAHFSYENLGGGAHCCWNSMYDPNQQNWQSFPTYGPYVATGADTNSRGDYHIGSSIFQWMLRQGDTSMVGGIVTPRPVANAGADQVITLPTANVVLSGSGSETGGTISAYAWKWFSGPSQYSISNANVANPTVSNLIAGTYVFQLTVTDANGNVASDTMSVMVNAAVVPPAVVSSPYLLPATIQAENYTSMNGVGTQTTSDAGGGLNVDWIEKGSWMTYTVNAPTAGLYTVNFRVASISSGASFQIDNGGSAVYATVAVPNTAGYQNWTTVSVNVSLPAGVQTIRLLSTAAAIWNINWLSFASGSTSQVIPGTIQAESYNTMNSVGTQTTTDAGGGLNVGWIDLGSWMAYTVNVGTAGIYTVNFRVASNNTGGSLQLDNGGSTVYATVPVPNTGGYQNWTTVSATVSLAAGVQTIRLLSTAAAIWNINWFSFTSGGAAAQTIPGTIQAESYSSMNNVATQATSDAGGGLNVGWIDNGSWMDYTVNVQTAGVYTVGFRVATSNSGASLQLDNGGSTVYAKVAVPSTGNYQAWNTINTTVTLPAGVQTLRVLSTAAPVWNLNWMQFNTGVTGASTGGGLVDGDAIAAFKPDSSVSQAPMLLLYPNPTTDVFQLSMNNAHSGKFQVQVITPAGRVLKTYTFVKGLPEFQTQVSLSGLPAGVYLIHVGGDDWQEIRKLVKL